ncbi:unnamed protein product [Ceutorhynchus assimilis]|uniref:DUF4485 domain-containing protein n=1 Tax=Ceutorhynchus assimilis TaxID=467358 RepID=A0A9N9MIF2_9CUCU|nr:unnamed protein product [Ceutorhynchus assimilis]
MAENCEAKLDDDFLFYCNFTCTFLKRILDHDVFRMARNWIVKLCCEPCEGVDRKRCRNMYLANLLICMQNGKLEEPFLQPPAYVDISDATQIFGSVPETVEKPSWLNDTDFEIHHKPTANDKPGRTYFATKTLPNGQGAFAYVGISLTDDDWMVPAMAAGDTSLKRQAAVDKQLSQKYREEVPQYEMEKILAKRKNPRERERVLAFYDALLQIVADELSGKASEFNETIEGLLEQLIDDLKTKGQYGFDQLDEYQKRMELLAMLYDRIKIRRDKVARREEILDDIEQKMLPQLFDVSATEPEDEYQLPAAMWQQAIEKMPSRRQMEHLKLAYPIPVVERFIVLLAAFKEDIAERMHRMHERIATQMKRELRKEGLKKKREADRAEKMCLETEQTYKAVTEHWKHVQALEEQNLAQTAVFVSDHTRLYEDLKAAALDTQKLVEEEAAKGKFLAEQINTLAVQGVTIKEINVETIKKREQVNAKILRSIKHLNHNIKIYESRISDIRNMGDQTRKNVTQILAGNLD